MSVLWEVQEGFLGSLHSGPQASFPLYLQWTEFKTNCLSLHPNFSQTRRCKIGCKPSF